LQETTGRAAVPLRNYTHTLITDWPVGRFFATCLDAPLMMIMMMMTIIMLWFNAHLKASLAEHTVPKKTKNS